MSRPASFSPKLSQWSMKSQSECCCCGRLTVYRLTPILLCLHIYIYMYVCMYVYIYIYVCVCMCAYIYICIYRSLSLSIYIYIHTNIHVRNIRICVTRASLKASGPHATASKGALRTPSETPSTLRGPGKHRCDEDCFLGLRARFAVTGFKDEGLGTFCSANLCCMT